LSKISILLRFTKKLPKVDKRTIGENSPSGKKLSKICILWKFTKKLPKVDNRPLGENSPNLVTLVVCRRGKSGNAYLMKARTKGNHMWKPLWFKDSSKWLCKSKIFFLQIKNFFLRVCLHNAG
jgi:hypothetical protein